MDFSASIKTTAAGAALQGASAANDGFISFQNGAGVIKFKQFTIFTEPLCEDGVLKFADQTHLSNFFTALKARCKKENLSDLYNTLYNNSNLKKYRDDMKDAGRCHFTAYGRDAINRVSTDCIEKDGLSSDMFARVKRFKKIAAYIHKITLPKNVKIFAHLKDTFAGASAPGRTDIHNWPPAEKRAFFAFCRNNMNRAEYNQFAAQVKGAKINLPAWDQIDVWCAQVNVCNPGKLAEEVQKHVTLGPALNDQKIGIFLAPHRKEIAEGKLVEAYIYLDNKTDAQGYLIPRLCLIPNKPLNIAYFNQLKTRHFVYDQAQNIFSPQAVRRVCNKLDEWNILERGFSYLDLAIIPALSKINNEIGRSALLEIYGVIMVFRQLCNPISLVRFFAGLSLLGEDVTQMVQVWKYGTSAQRALLVGSIIGLLFGPKAFKTATAFFADSVISFQARKIGSISTTVQKGNSVYSIIPNKKTGFVTIIRDDGTAVAFKKGADGNLTAVPFKAPKGNVPKRYAKAIKNSGSEPAPAGKPAAATAKRPAPAQSRRGDLAGRPYNTKPASAPSLAMSVLAEAGKRMRIAAVPVTRGINTVRAMINAAALYRLVQGAAALMADGVNATAATLSGTPHHAVQGAAGTGNIPARTTIPIQMASEGKPKDSNSPERQMITGKSGYDPAEPISAEKKAELIRKLKDMSREDGLALIHKTIRDIYENDVKPRVEDYMQNVFFPKFRRQIADIAFAELISEFGSADKIPQEAPYKKMEELKRRMGDICDETGRTARKPFLAGLQGLYIELRDALLNERSSPLDGNERLTDDIIFAATESEREPIRDIIKELPPVVLSNLKEEGVLITIEEGKRPHYNPVSRTVNVYTTSSPHEYEYKAMILHDVFHALCKNPKIMNIIKEIYDKICRILKDKDAGTSPCSPLLRSFIMALDTSPHHQHCKGQPRPGIFYEELVGTLFAAFCIQTADMGGLELPISYVFRMEERDLFDEIQKMISLLNENSSQSASTGSHEEKSMPSLKPNLEVYNPEYFLGEANKSIDKLQNSKLNNYQWLSSNLHKCNLMFTSLSCMLSDGACEGREQELMNAVMSYYQLILEKANNLSAAEKAKILLDFKEKVILAFRENEALSLPAVELFMSLTEGYRTQGKINCAAPREYANLERIAQNKKTDVPSLFKKYFADKLKDGQAKRNFTNLLKKIANGENQNNKPGPASSVSNNTTSPAPSAPRQNGSNGALARTMDKINDAAGAVARALDLTHQPITAQGVRMPVPPRTQPPTMLAMDGNRGAGSSIDLRVQWAQLLADMKSPDFEQNFPITAGYCKKHGEMYDLYDSPVLYKQYMQHGLKLYSREKETADCCAELELLESKSSKFSPAKLIKFKNPESYAYYYLKGKNVELLSPEQIKTAKFLFDIDRKAELICHTPNRKDRIPLGSGFDENIYGTLLDMGIMGASPEIEIIKDLLKPAYGLLEANLLQKNITALGALPIEMLQDLKSDGITLWFDSRHHGFGWAQLKKVFAGDGDPETTLHETGHRVYRIISGNDTDIKSTEAFFTGWLADFKKLVAERRQKSSFIKLSYLDKTSSGDFCVSRYIKKDDCYLDYVEGTERGRAFSGFFEVKEESISKSTDSEYFAEFFRFYYYYKSIGKLKELEKMDKGIFDLMDRFDKIWRAVTPE